MLKKFDIITIVGAVRDITFHTDKGRVFRTPEDIASQRILGFEYGAKINIEQAYCSFGGGAFNTAVTFSKMGFKVAPIVAIGQDQDGMMIKDKLRKDNIYDGLVQTNKNLQNCL